MSFKKCPSVITNQYKPIQMETSSTFEQNGLVFTLDENSKTADIVKCLSEEEVISISRSINYGGREFIITGILKESFKYAKTIQFPEDSELTTIGEKSFHISRLECISIPPHVTQICKGAFSDSRFLVQVNFPNNSELQILGKKAFSDTRIERIKLPSQLVRLCESSLSIPCLKTIEIPEDSKLKTIEKCAISSRIESIFIPSNVTDLQDGWCEGAPELKNIIVSKNNHNYVYYNDEFLLGKTNPTQEEYDKLLFVRRDIKKVKIPPFIKIISPYSFSECCITEISIPSGITEIGEGSFYNCKNLSKVIFSADSKLELIGDHAFHDTAIQSIVIPQHVTHIGNFAFFSKYLNQVLFHEKSELLTIGSSAFSESSIKEITIPASVLKIDECAFCYCRFLKKIEFPKNSRLQVIEKSAFDSTIIAKITIPSSLIKLGAKSLCIKDLTEVEIPEDSNLVTIENSAFARSYIKSIFIPSNVTDLQDGWCEGTSKLKNIIVSKNNHNYVYYNDEFLLGKTNPTQEEYDKLLFVRRDIKKVTIPPFIKIISPYSFSECCITEIFIPSGITEIKKYSFNNSQNLRKVEFASNSKLVSICDYSFSNTAINSISIMPLVTSIGKYAFENCNDLQQVSFKGSNLSIINESTFRDTALSEIMIPSSVTFIGESAFFGCKKLEKVEFEENSKLKTIGKGAFMKTSIVKISIPPLVSEICQETFKECSELIQVDIPPNSEIQSISDYSFEKTRIKNIFIPSKTTKIGHDAFKNSSLEKVEFASNSKLKTIDSTAFERTHIKSISIPLSVENIKIMAFYNSSLGRVDIPENSKLEIIADMVLASTLIESIFIPKNIKCIECGAFNECYLLKNVEIPKDSKLQTIKKRAFNESKIESIFIPSSVIDLQDGWCEGTSKLKNIIVSKNNHNYVYYNDEFLLGKTNPTQEEYDKLLFVRRDIKKVTIPPFIKIISPYSFSECCITEIFIPSGITEIGKGSFYRCRNLRKFEFASDSNLKLVGDEVIDVTSIKYICLPPTITFLGKSAFSNCDKLLHIDFPSELQIQKINFFRCKSLVSAKIPAYNASCFLTSIRRCKNFQIIEFAEKPDIQLSDIKFRLKGVLVMIPVK